MPNFVNYFWGPYAERNLLNGSVMNCQKIAQLFFHQINGPQVRIFHLVVIQRPQILIERKVLDSGYLHGLPVLEVNEYPVGLGN